MLGHTMRMTALLIPLALATGCKKETESSPAPTPGETPPPPSPTPAPPPGPPPTPVQLTADELKPTCAKIFTPDVATAAFGATTVKPEETSNEALAICQFEKDGTSLGQVTISCAPDLDTTLIERERDAMSKAKSLPGQIGRGGYRLANNFNFIDDETPCRITASYMTPPEGDALAGALRAIVAAVNPATLK
jgi:hypothetical protein